MNKKILFLAPLLSLAFMPSCSKADSNWWDNTDQLTKDDIGKIESIKVNGITQKVRLIDVNHDSLASGGKAHTTWEFVDLLSDEDGFSLATLWDTEHMDGSDNQDFINSDLRKALDGEGKGHLNWFQKGKTAVSTNYSNKSVLSMLPEGLQKVLKEVTKPVNINDKGAGYVVDNNYKTKVFVLSATECCTSLGDGSEEGSPYKYYNEMFKKSVATLKIGLIKHQIDWHEGALSKEVTAKIKVFDSEPKEWEISNFAGYNDNKEEMYGSNYSLRTPNLADNDLFYRIGYEGTCGANIAEVDTHAYGVAPAFCI